MCEARTNSKCIGGYVVSLAQPRGTDHFGTYVNMYVLELPSKSTRRSSHEDLKLVGVNVHIEMC